MVPDGGPVDGSASAGPSAATARLRWCFRRNCALTPRQCAWAFALAAAASLAVSSAFWALGAQLVLPFAVLETVALGWAFVWYARHATDREVLEWDGRRLLVECEQGGAVVRHELVRPGLRVVEADGGGLVELCAGPKVVRVGRHARPEQRRQLARELRRALRVG